MIPAEQQEFAIFFPLIATLFFLLCSGQAIGSPRALQSAEQGTSQAENGNKSQGQVASRLPRLSVGDQTANPGNTAVVPLYLTPPGGIEIRSVSAEIEWKSAQLPFASFQRGIAAEAVGADVGVKVIRTSQDADGEEQSVLQVDVSLAPNFQRGIPEGLLVYLTYQVAKDAKPAQIELRPKLISAEAIGTPGQRFVQAEVESGKVVIEEAPALPPYVNCFFFTH